MGLVASESHLELDTWNWSLIQENISGYPLYDVSNLLTATITPTLSQTYTVFEALTSLYTEKNFPIWLNALFESWRGIWTEVAPLNLAAHTSEY